MSAAVSIMVTSYMICMSIINVGGSYLYVNVYSFDDSIATINGINEMLYNVGGG